MEYHGSFGYCITAPLDLAGHMAMITCSFWQKISKLGEHHECTLPPPWSD